MTNIMLTDRLTVVQFMTIIHDYMYIGWDRRWVLIQNRTLGVVSNSDSVVTAWLHGVIHYSLCTSAMQWVQLVYTGDW